MTVKKAAKNSGNSPVVTRKPNRQAWLAATQLAGMDAGRLFTVANGAVIVANSRKRPPWLANHL